MIISQFHRKHLMLRNGSMTMMQTIVKSAGSKMEFWQTKPFAIMTYATIPGDCIDRVTSQNGERVNFERLETPRLAPWVTLKKNWYGQQQPHSASGTDVPSPLKMEAEIEHWTGAQGSSEPSTGGKSSPRKVGQTTSDMENGCSSQRGRYHR